MAREDRRDQIVMATMDLLATLPPDRITTRLIASRVGVTQPALFRHFDGRDDILVATVAWTRQELEGLVERVLRGREPPLERAGALARGLGEHASRYPGLPRLLFADVVRGEGEAFAAGLGHLVGLQRALVAQLVREARALGDVPAEVDPERAARLFVGGLQGLLLQWQMDGRPGAPDVDALVTHWTAGLRAGVPKTERPAPAVEAPVGERLDVRPMIARGVDPLEVILAAAGRLAPGEALLVVAPFRPAPLLVLLESRGYGVGATEDAGTWTVRVEAR